MNKSNLILAFVLAIIFTSILIIFSPTSKKSSPSSPTSSPISAESTSPTTDPTVDWKTYENDKFGFSLKYPQNLKPIINSTNQTTIVEFINDASNNSTNSVFYISYMENPNNLSIPDFYKELTDKSDMFVANPFTATIKPESIQVDSHPGFRFITPGVLFNDVVSILLSNKTILGINRTIYEKNTIDESSKKVFDQILSTFKFTDSTADWKTYENKEYGFSLEIPNYLVTKSRPNFPWQIDFWNESDDTTGYYKYYLNPLGDPQNYKTPLFWVFIDGNSMKALQGDDGNGPQELRYIKPINENFGLFYSGVVLHNQVCATEKNNKTIMVECSDKNLSDPLFNQILSTFKFL